MHKMAIYRNNEYLSNNFERMPLKQLLVMKVKILVLRLLLKMFIAACKHRTF